MQIYVVKPGDTLFSIGRALGLAPGFLARYNGLQEPYRLAVGQSLLVLYPEQTVTVQPGDTLTSIAASAGTDVASLYRMNPNLSGSDRIYPGQILVTQLEQAARRPAVVSGYAYPNVSERVLRGILPYAGALVAGISAVWALARMSRGGARLRSYVYEETVAKLPLRCLLTGGFAALAAVGECMDVFLNGGQGAIWYAVLFAALAAAAAAAAFAAGHTIRAAVYTEESDSGREE